MRPCGQTVAQDVLRRKRSGHNKTCGKPREDLGRIQTSTNQGERDQMQARLLTAWSPDFSPPSLGGKMHFCCVIHSACGTLCAYLGTLQGDSASRARLQLMISRWELADSVSPPEGKSQLGQSHTNLRPFK